MHLSAAKKDILIKNVIVPLLSVRARILILNKFKIFNLFIDCLMEW